ncbi:MAG: PQQ-binding-like beta-propeller repeat protein [Cohaesibacteraceae bacterium]|nr:PQQ-binding-like beta-propeller repeat protein [Cohaesibacteraceae bacterium]
MKSILLHRFIVVGLLATGLSACSAVSEMGLFGAEKILPGERQPILNTGLHHKVEDSGPVLISSSKSFSGWNNPGGNAANNPPNVTLSGSGTTAWRVNAALRGGSDDYRAAARPIVIGGRVAVYGPDGSLSVHGLSGGGRAWSANLRPDAEKDIALGGGVAASASAIFAGTGYGEAIAISLSNGARIWTKKLEAPVRGAPTYNAGKVFVVTATNVVYALDAADGSELWTYRGLSETAGILAAANPAVEKNIVVVPFSSGEVVAINIKTGEPEWTDQVVRASRSFALSGLTDISASPVISGGVVYVVGVSGRIIAVSLKSGERLWERNIGSVHTPVVSGNALFVLDLDDKLVALNRKTGKIHWSTQLPVIRKRKKRSAWAGPVLAGGKLWLASSDKKYVGVNAANGKPGNVQSIADAVYISPIAVSGRVILLSGNGALSAHN